MTSAANRMVLIHEDDLGMCHGANAAFFELTGVGTCRSGSVMVPCPWFLELAERAAASPQLDVGVHLTLTSEKRYFRWRPLTRPTRAAGLTDGDGFFWRTAEEAIRYADEEAVEAEIRAQVEAARDAGISISHLDAHMGVARSHRFLGIYLDVAAEYGLPVVMCKTLAGHESRSRMGFPDDEPFLEQVRKVEARKGVLFDRAMQTPWERTGDATATYKAILRSLPSGLTFLALHFNKPGEVEAIEPETAHLRIAEYELFRRPEFGAWLDEQDIRVISFRDL